jgi:hypothetical protein
MLVLPNVSVLNHLWITGYLTPISLLCTYFQLYSYCAKVRIVSVPHAGRSGSPPLVKSHLLKGFGVDLVPFFLMCEAIDWLIYKLHASINIQCVDGDACVSP